MTLSEWAASLGGMNEKTDWLATAAIMTWTPDFFVAPLFLVCQTPNSQLLTYPCHFRSLKNWKSQSEEERKKCQVRHERSKVSHAIYRFKLSVEAEFMEQELLFSLFLHSSSECCCAKYLWPSKLFLFVIVRFFSESFQEEKNPRFMMLTHCTPLSGRSTFLFFTCLILVL